MREREREGRRGTEREGRSYCRNEQAELCEPASFSAERRGRLSERESQRERVRERESATR